MTLPHEPSSPFPLPATADVPVDVVPFEADWHQKPHVRAPRTPWQRAKVPMLLAIATCVTTLIAGGPLYAFPLMFILGCHEFGHYLQARRYRVPATLPYFIPMVPPLGTMGAVISMSGEMGNRKALFDIGISGPLAGLGPALICSAVGLAWSTIVEIPADARGHLELGEPLLFQWMTNWYFGQLPANQTIYLHPLGYAGWVGIFITAVNLFPIGQLDGGHVLYAILRKKAHLVATGLLALLVLIVILTSTYQWFLMLTLLAIMGPKHPPTADDDAPLGWGRTVLGCVTLLFVIIGFTPRPFPML